MCKILPEAKQARAKSYLLLPNMPHKHLLIQIIGDNIRQPTDRYH